MNHSTGNNISSSYIYMLLEQCKILIVTWETFNKMVSIHNQSSST